MKLTSKERLTRIFRGEEIDRPALKLWGAQHYLPALLHPAYAPVTQLAYETTDILGNMGYAFNVYAGQNMESYQEDYVVDTDDPNKYIHHTTFHTPKGDLHMARAGFRDGYPGYTLEYMIKEPEDLERLLSMDYKPFPLCDRKAYDDAVAQMGDRGVVSVHLDEAIYAIQRLCGSETLAYFSVDERELLTHTLHVYRDRILDHVKSVLALGIQPCFSMVGPEIALPPLMSPADFCEFVHDADKPIGDLIHNGGGHFWVHCHGKVANFIDQFIDMGVDVLNPLEPPKNGDIDLNAIIAKYGNRIGWEGNIEIQEILSSPKERIRALIDECVEAGAKSGRFILCPSAGSMEYPAPTETSIENLMFYLQYGLEAVERYRKY